MEQKTELQKKQEEAMTLAINIARMSVAITNARNRFEVLDMEIKSLMDKKKETEE